MKGVQDDVDQVLKRLDAHDNVRNELEGRVGRETSLQRLRRQGEVEAKATPIVQEHPPEWVSEIHKLRSEVARFKASANRPVPDSEAAQSVRGNIPTDEHSLRVWMTKIWSFGAIVDSNSQTEADSTCRRVMGGWGSGQPRACSSTRDRKQGVCGFGFRPRRLRLMSTRWPVRSQRLAVLSRCRPPSGTVAPNFRSLPRRKIWLEGFEVIARGEQIQFLEVFLVMRRPPEVGTATAAQEEMTWEKQLPEPGDRWKLENCFLHGRLWRVPPWPQGTRTFWDVLQDASRRPPERREILPESPIFLERSGWECL